MERSGFQRPELLVIDRSLASLYPALLPMKPEVMAIAGAMKRAGVGHFFN